MQVAVQHRRWDPVPTLPGARTRCWTWITGQVLPPVRPTSEIPMRSAQDLASGML